MRTPSDDQPAENVPSTPPAGPPALSDAEWEVMEVFWTWGKMAARDVFARLPEKRGWAFRTVKTLLSRLVAKGALTYEQIGNSYLYHPACVREEVARAKVEGLADRILGGSLSAVFARLIEKAPLSKEEIQRLRGILDEKEKK